jgi:phosphohistidine phosphatase
MDLYLVRHAQAADGGRYRRDEDRPLTAEGRRQAQAVGRALAGAIEAAAQPALIIVSPLVRAVETAELIAVALGYGEALEVALALGPDGRPDDMLDCAYSALGDSVMLVGHEPSMGHLLSSLLGARSLALSKGTCVRLRAGRGEPSGELLWVVSPRRLQPTGSIDAL